MSTKTDYREYIASEWWQERRRRFLAKWDFCWKCDMPRWLAAIAYDQDLHVHHRSYAHLGAETDHDLMPLCRRCHDIETFGRSDFKAPQSHKCHSCGRTHWDRYSDDCLMCSEVKVGSLPLEDCVWHNEMKHAGRPMWTEAVYLLCRIIGADAVLDYIASNEGFFRREHEWHLEKAEERKSAEPVEAIQ